MVTAFVLINLKEKTNKKTVAESMVKLPGVVEVDAVAGEYDLVVEIKAADNAALTELMAEHIVHAPGILHTKTLFSQHSFEK